MSDMAGQRVPAVALRIGDYLDLEPGVFRVKGVAEKMDGDRCVAVMLWLEGHEPMEMEPGRSVYRRQSPAMPLVP